MPAPINLTEKDLEKIRVQIDDDRHHAKRERADWEQALPRWRRLYEGVVREKSRPWKGASNVNLDMIADECDEFTARAMNVLFTDQRWAPAAPVEDSDHKRWPIVEQFMQWALQSEMKAWGDFEAICQETAINGTCFVYVPWDRKVRSTLEQRYLAGEVSIGPFKRRLKDRQLLEAIFGDQLQSARASDGKWICRIIEEGPETTATCYIDREIEDRPGEVLVEIEREEIVRDCPRLHVLEPTDVYTTDVGDIQDAPFVQVQQWVTVDWMKRRKSQGLYNFLSDKEWGRIVSSQTEFKQQSDFGPTDIKEEKDQATGVDTDIQASRTRPILTVFMRWDINDDGFEEEIVVEYDVHTSTILGVDYLNRRYPHGRRPIVVFRYRQIANRLYGTGIPEMLWNLQVMINTLINQAIDAQTLANTPWFFFDKSSGLDDRGEALLKPGKGIGVLGNPGEKVFFPGSMVSPMDKLMPFVQQLMEFTDRRVGRFSFSQGSKQGGIQGAVIPKTFGGTNLLLQEELLRLEHVIKQLANGGQGSTSGFNELFHQIYEMYAKLMPKKKKFRIMGSEGAEFMEVSRDDLRMRPDFMFSVNMANANPAIRQQNALMLMQNFLPILTNLGAQPQIRAIMQRVTQAFAIPNAEELIPELPNMLRRAPMPQEIENQLLMQDIPLDVLPIDNDAEHIAIMDEFEQDVKAQNILLQPEAWAEFNQHRMEHIQALERKEKAAAAQANGGGRPMGGERRTPGQMRPPRPVTGGEFSG